MKVTADPRQLSLHELRPVMSLLSGSLSQFAVRGWTTGSFPAPTFYVEKMQMMNTYLANNTQSLPF